MNIGFGCYRINELVEEHRQSLSKALLAGVNVIDTSANYADGGSESLIGNVVAELTASGNIERKNITLITKGGYIQGKNLTVAREKRSRGNAFRDVIEFNEKLWHSISPDFLEDQFQRQFERLKVEYVDTYLLHNPEYSLSFRNSSGASLEENRNLFYGRVEKAFEFLEDKVREGRIRDYGISSNTFVSYKESTEFVSLERCIAAAEKVAGSGNHFRSVQFPLNLFEGGAVTVRNNSDSTKTVLEYARERGMKVYVNRPLNAIMSTGLVRLADFKADDFREKDFIRQNELVKQMEADITNEILPREGVEGDELKLISDKFTTGRMIYENWKFFGSIEHLNDMIMQTYTPAISEISHFAEGRRSNENLFMRVQKYVHECHKLMNFVSNYYKLRAGKRAQFIHGLINEHLPPGYHGLSLARKALLVTASVRGVSSVLLGMRKPGYVDDALEVMKLRSIENAEEIIRHASSEILNIKN